MGTIPCCGWWWTVPVREILQRVVQQAGISREQPQVHQKMVRAVMLFRDRTEI